MTSSSSGPSPKQVMVDSGICVRPASVTKQLAILFLLAISLSSRRSSRFSTFKTIFAHASSSHFLIFSLSDFLYAPIAP